MANDLADDLLGIVTSELSDEGRKALAGYLFRVAHICDQCGVQLVVRSSKALDTTRRLLYFKPCKCEETRQLVVRVQPRS